MTRRLLALPAVALAAAILLPPGTAAQEEPAFDPATFYEQRCAFCHGPGGWGTRKLEPRVPSGEAELLNRTDLPPAYTALVVRRGIGAMPQFTPTELTDAQLAELARWLDDRN